MDSGLVSRRSKIYLILMSLSLALFSYSIWQVYPIMVEVTDPLGLASRLPPAYWAGLALLVLTGVLAFLDREVKAGVYLSLLFALGLFLVGVTALGYANARNPNDYYFMGQVGDVLAEHRVDIAHPGVLVDYSSWPAYHFISAGLLSITGAGPGFILKYWDLLGVALIILATYAIGRRLGLAPNRCYLLSLLSLSSWWAGFFGYSSRSLAMILLLLLFMLVIAPRKTIAETVVVMLATASLVITHGFASLALLPALALVAIYRRDSRYVILSVVMFGAWYLYQATASFRAGVQQFMTYPLAQLLHQAQAESYEAASAAARAVARYSQLGRLALYVPYVSAAVILLAGGRMTAERRRQVLSLLFWLGGVSLVVFLGYGEELYRAYLFAVVPAAAIIALSVSRRALLVPLMCLMVALFPLANYATEASWGQLLTTELRGAEFVATRAPESAHSYYYGLDFGLMRYFNPDMKAGVLLPKYAARSPEAIDPSVLDGLDFVIMSKQGTDAVLFGWGVDPYAAWPQTESGREADLVYENGRFEVYRN